MNKQFYDAKPNSEQPITVIIIMNFDDRNKIKTWKRKPMQI